MVDKQKMCHKACFRIARQMAREERHVISVCCMKNDVVNIVSDADGMKNIWRKYMGGPTEAACSIAVPAMNTRPRTSAL